MISWIWIPVSAVAGCILGVLALALVTVASKADDWADGYRAGRDDKDA